MKTQLKTGGDIVLIEMNLLGVTPCSEADLRASLIARWRDMATEEIAQMEFDGERRDYHRGMASALCMTANMLEEAWSLENCRASGVKMSHGEATTQPATEGRATSPAMDAVAGSGEARPDSSQNSNL